MKTPEQYEIEIAALRAELERLRSGALLTMAGAKSMAAGPGGSFTIAGLEEMVLLVDENGTLSFLNTEMARLLGAEHKAAVLGSSVERWDQGPLGEGFMATLVGSAHHSGQTYVIERSFPNFPKERLSRPDDAHGDATLFRFVATPVKGKVQIVVQDITHARWLEESFSRYVSPRVIERLRSVPESELMQVERRRLTVLFGDLRGFTLACQEMEAEEVCEMLNGYLAAMTECVDRYEGMVDKFVGDEIMAVFGAPLHTEDHALRALLTAEAMVKAHRTWQEARKAQGKMAPAVGIGLATGEVVLGNVGAAQRMDYTVLGHTVNLAARLCAKAEAFEILTIKATHQAAMAAVKSYPRPEEIPRFRFESKGQIELKNVKAPVDVFRVLT
jgi:class 3 adenylate cyclase